MLTIAHIWKCDLCGNVKMEEDDMRPPALCPLTPDGWTFTSDFTDDNGNAWPCVTSCPDCAKEPTDG